MNRKTSTFLIVAASFLLGLPAASAQAPANATGICKDGTYSTAASKDGACRGHKGVQTWYSADTASKRPPTPAASSAAKPSPTPAAATRPMPAPAPAPTPAPAKPNVTNPASAPAPAATAQPKPGISAERAKLATMQPAPGGGPGLVWLNGSSKVYHCPGTEFYGKTKTGAYVSEADAKAKGAHADHNKPCS